VSGASAPIPAARVAVVVLNHNGADDTIACLRSLSDLDAAPGRIQIVDNASTDDSVDRIRTALPEIDLSINATNLGFGAGLNPALERLLAGGWSWIWLLNNDATVRPDTLDRLLARAGRRADTGAVGARIVDAAPPHALQSLGGGTVGWWRGNSRHLRKPIAGTRLDYLTGASLLLRGRALREIGLFDPRFFLYWEDVDLCLRLRAAGWHLTVADDAVVRHRLSAATGAVSAEKDALINASGVRFFRKHGRLGGWLPIVLGVAGRISRRALRGDLAAVRAVWRGAQTGLRNSGG
jgi:GT2 family glycosyltransferase